MNTNVLFEYIEPHFEEIITLARNEILVSKGTFCTDLYFIERGTVRIFFENEFEEHTIRFGYKNSFITALDCFLKEVPTVFTIQALKKTTVRKISKFKYLELMFSSADTLKLLQSLQQDLIYQQLERELDLLTISPQNRLERVLVRSPQLFQEIPHKYIASYLRMAPETLSRILKNLDLNQE